MASDDWGPVPSTRSGYLQFVDYGTLLDYAGREGIVVREERAVGAFIIPGAPLVFVSPASKITPNLQAQINDAFVRRIECVPYEADRDQFPRPVVDDSCVLPGAKVRRFADATRE